MATQTTANPALTQKTHSILKDDKEKEKAKKDESKRRYSLSVDDRPTRAVTKQLSGIVGGGSSARMHLKPGKSSDIVKLIPSQYDRPIYLEKDLVTESELFRRFGVLNTVTKKVKSARATTPEQSQRPIWFTKLTDDERAAFKKIFKHLHNTTFRQLNIKTIHENLKLIEPTVTYEAAEKYVLTCRTDVHHKINFAELLFNCAGIDHAILQRAIARNSIIDHADLKAKTQDFNKSFTAKQRKYITAIGLFVCHKTTKQVGNLFDPSVSQKPHVLVDFINMEKDCARIVRDETAFHQLHTQLLLESLADATNSPYAVPLMMVEDPDKLEKEKLKMLKLMKQRKLRSMRKEGETEKERAALLAKRRMTINQVWISFKKHRCLLTSGQGFKSHGYVDQKKEYENLIAEQYTKIRDFRLKNAREAEKEIVLDGMRQKTKKWFKKKTMKAYLPQNVNDCFVINPYDPRYIPAHLMSGKRELAKNRIKAFS